MGWPEDWDKPSEHNIELCKQFSKEVYEINGFRLLYRFYQPGITGEGSEKVPLVLYLHGADAVGKDNELPITMHDIGTMFARPSWQREHPCYVLAPQYGPSQYWSQETMKTAVMTLIEEMLSEHPEIDSGRLYIYGYSAGGVGTFRMLKEFPGRFRAAIAICGATGEEDMERLSDVPIYMIHAEDDEIVRVTYGSSQIYGKVHLGSRDIWGRYKGVFSKLKYKELPAGYMKKTYGVNAHCSWVEVSDENKPEYREWLFAQ
ncbi:MAG: prolyl oligopeptidase family serine peptidase [Lachnospiraceae bacterium]|nr:prolyl oligopeptidase family serine peptidase [Lachnospiraceae bacterium]